MDICKKESPGARGLQKENAELDYVNLQCFLAFIFLSLGRLSQVVANLKVTRSYFYRLTSYPTTVDLTHGLYIYVSQ